MIMHVWQALIGGSTDKDGTSAQEVRVSRKQVLGKQIPQEGPERFFALDLESLRNLVRLEAPHVQSMV